MLLKQALTDTLQRNAALQVPFSALDVFKGAVNRR
jgi:hypothetical protein